MVLEKHSKLKCGCAFDAGPRRAVAWYSLSLELDALEVGSRWNSSNTGESRDLALRHILEVISKQSLADVLSSRLSKWALRDAMDNEAQYICAVIPENSG
jgi:hypothetical protein